MRAGTTPGTANLRGRNLSRVLTLLHRRALKPQTAVPAGAEARRNG